eukprot:TRINITY_DN7831_c0_g1_i1.p1 TRINITY_DN7831_c0_g1~~TRINITY_DN7831_c0_g1_i1.p1  ORF type:complete len:407 (+),score=52.42 TRINITY_DN7831_c0_g1_i1:347-1567(+)
MMKDIPREEYAAELARLGIPPRRPGLDRLHTLEKHLEKHPGRGKGIKWGRYAWLAPPILAGMGMVAAWRHQRTREKILGVLFSGGMWALKRHFSGAGAMSTDNGQFLLDSEVSTHEAMRSIELGIESAFPLDEMKQKLKAENRGNYTKDEIKSIWADLVVATLSRVISGVYTLAATHFISTAVHALTPSDDICLSSATEIHDLPINIDISLLTRTISDACREALRERSLTEFKAASSFTDIQQIFNEVRTATDIILGIHASSSTALHEAILGEEGEVEPELLKKLRDLIESQGPKNLLVRTIGDFFSIALNHIKEARVELKAEGDEVKVPFLKLNPRLSAELVKITEDSNEYLISVRNGQDSEESPWASFFLDLNALVEDERPAKSQLTASPARLPSDLSAAALFQ